ncbi:MAG TPA: dihydrofolate reductase [Bacteroidia bacterium]|jgi:dihydrofolate reductase|nr:dihydrofolate reductase [Bacteroidia bacterium]
MIISLVAAASDNNVIGINNTLPWKMPADMKFFKNLTMGHIVIMGRKTFESMDNKPLPGRINVVISRKKNFSTNGCTVLDSLAEAFTKFGDQKEVFIIGGSQIFNTSLPQADKIYLTRIHHTFNGDSYFPELSDKEWVELSRESHPQDEKNPFPYSFIVLGRKKLS